MQTTNDLDHLQQWLSILYSPVGSSTGNTPQLQQEAQRALFHAQQQPSAWQWPAALLAESDPTLRFFGAHTLALKISRDLATLDEANHASLRSSLLSWLAQSAKMAYPKEGLAVPAERAVYTKLSVALSSLSLHLQPKGEWENWLLESTMTLSGTSCSKDAIYELLVIVVEEASRADLVGRARVSYDGSLSSAGDWVAASLIDTLKSSPPPKLLDIAVRCCSKWGTSSYLKDASLADLFPALLHHLIHSPDAAPVVGACLEEWFLEAAAFFTPTRVAPLLDLFTGPWFRAVLDAAQQEEEGADENVTAYVKLFICLFESSADSAVQNLTSELTVNLLQNLLSIQSFPGQYPSDEQVSHLALNSWEFLQEALAENGHVGSRSPESKLGNDIFHAAVQALRSKVSWPEDADANFWSKETQEEFQQYRRDAGDALLNCYYVLRDDILATLCRLTLDERNQLASGGSLNSLEATLFVLKAIAEGVPHEESIPLQHVISSDFLSQLPLNGRLCATTLSMIGEYAEWLGQNQPSQLPALQFVMNAFAHKELAWSAASALFKICDTCRSSLVPLASELVAVVANLSSGQLEEQEYLKVIRSVASVLQALPSDEAVPQMLVLCEPALGQLEAVVLESVPQGQSLEDVCLMSLKTLAACATGMMPPFQELAFLDGETQQPQSDDSVLVIRQRLLLLVTKIVERFSTHDDIATALSDFFKAACKTDQTSPLALDSVQLFALSINAARVELSSLWIAVASNFPSQIISGPDSKGTSQDFGAYASGVTACIETVTQALPSTETLEAQPDVVQAFMSLMREVMRFSPGLLAGTPDALASLYNTCMIALGIQERVALQRTLSLLSTFVQESATNLPHAGIYRQLVLARGQEALFFLASGIGGTLPRSNLSYLSELLHAFVVRYPDQSRLWLTKMFSEEGFPSPRLNADQKHRFLVQLMASRTLKKTRGCVETFALQARGLENTAYGMGSSAL